MTLLPPPAPAPAAPPSDAMLLRTWVRHRDEDAFRTLAQRHLNFVIATACRCTGHLPLAEEATQMVLTILARKAASLERVPLSPWLHRTTILECRALMRRESRHRRRVNALASEPVPEPSNSVNDDAWQDALPVLDEVIDRLGDEDRRVLMLRFFEDMTFREIAGRIGKTEAAVQRQGHRALERLGSLLRRRGVILPAATLAAGLGAVHAAIPAASSAGHILTNLFAATAPQPGAAALILNSLHTMSQTKLAVTTAAVVSVLAAVPIGLQYRENGRLAQALVSAESKITALTASISPSRDASSPGSESSGATAAHDSSDATAKGRRVTAGRKGSEEKKPAETKTNAFAGLGEYLDNPQMKKVLEAQITGQIESMYGGYIDSLNLTPDERKHLLNIMTGWMTASTQDALKAMGGTPEDRKKLQASAESRTKEQRERIREFLNDENDYNRYVAWEDRLQEHQAMNAIRQELVKRSAPLTPEKEQALVELMYKERKATAFADDYSNPRQKLDTERPFNEESIDAHMKELETLNERIATAAAGLLTPDQIEGLRTANRTNLQMARTALKMASTVLGNVQGTAPAPDGAK